ncbi:MAG: ARMT1-like domain-containing protein [Halobacteriota archaeon]|nr:ARMT1-like domain-containing protein [Halobacteriota archaeon]
MKVKTECLSCLFERGTYMCDLVINDESRKFEALKELLDYASKNFSIDSVPAVIGTERENIIKKYSGSDDPYEELKKKSNKAAEELLPIAENFYNNSSDKLEALIRIMATANSMEYGVRGHSFDHETFGEVFEETLRERLVGDIDKIRSRIDGQDKILYILDNCGEDIFDIFAIERLVEMGKEVVTAPKTEPIINDATVKDLIEAGFKHKVVPSGPCIGVNPEMSTEEFLDLFWNPEYLILAKGMGNYETISEFEEELKGRLIYILRAKCNSVASNLKVNRGELVARLV